MPAPSITGELFGIKSGNLRVVSRSSVLITDLLSEGQIEGIVSKEYTLNGTVYNTGWTEVVEAFVAPSSPVNSHLASVYLNDVPILGRDGQYNFQNIQFSKVDGLPNGNFSSIRETKKTIPINERLRGPNYVIATKRLVGPGDQFAKYYKILNKNCIAIEVNVKIGSLFYVDRTTDPTKTKTTDSTVIYSINYRPIYLNVIPDRFALAETVVIQGRITDPYIESTRISLSRSGADALAGPKADENFLGWEIKIYRSTLDSIDQDTQNSTSIESISELHDSRFSYPNSATTSITFDAEYFSKVPTRSYDTRLLKVKIPKNYDPIKKNYSGVWDGKFKKDKEWTDNPAWCFYDLVTNSRYGLGKYIDSERVDKWTLYEIGQYCDVLVPDGFGGIEPRFTTNLLLQSREEAYKVINDMTSIFRGISYYAAGNIYVNQDNDKKRPIYQFTNANVEEGEFLYASSSSKLRHNVAIVRYNDKTNFFKPAIEVVEDVDGIRKNGIREIELSAFGCTSRGQANRLGRWVLFTENLETETAAFTAGLEANYLRPGDVISVSDQDRNSRRRGGRLSGFDAANKTLTLDSAIAGIKANQKYCISLLTPSFSYEPSLVEIDYSDKTPNIRRSHVQNFYIQGTTISVTEGSTVVTLSPNFPNTGAYALLKNAVWTLSVSGNEPGKPFPNVDSVFNDDDNFNEFSSKNETFRILSVEESDANKYKISAIEFNLLKFIAIESGLSFDVSYSDDIPSPAKEITFQQINQIGNSKIINYTINYDESSTSLGVLSNYLVYAKSSISKDFNPWIKGDYQLTNSVVGSSTESMVGHAGELSMLPNPQYKIATLAAHSKSSVSAKFAPSESEVFYFFKVFATNASSSFSNAIPGISPKIENNFPIKDISIKNLRLSTDINQINNAGTKNDQASQYASHSPTFLFNVGFTGAADKLTNFSSNFYYRITFRDATSSNTPSTIIKRTITGYFPPDSVNPSFDYLFSDNYLDNNALPKRTYEVVVEAHDSHGNSSAGGNFVTSTDSAYTNSNGYDILQVDNPRASGFILTDPGAGCALGQSYCTEQFWEYGRDLKIIFNKIPSSLSDAAGGFVYASSGFFVKNDIVGRSIADVNRLGIEVLEFTKFENPISVRPSGLTIYSAPHIFVAYSLYDSFDKQWRDLAASKGTAIELSEKSNEVSNVSRAIRPEVRYFNGEGYKAWILIDLARGGVGRLPYIKSFGIKSVQILDIYDGLSNAYTETAGDLCALPAGHPYKNFRGIRRSHCKSALEIQLYGKGITNIGSLFVDSASINSYYCGFNTPRANGEMDEMTKSEYMKTPVTSFDSHTKWVRLRCYFDTEKTEPPIFRNNLLVPIQDDSPYDYNTCYSEMNNNDPKTKYTRYKGDYHIIGDNINNDKYPAINDTKMKSISSLFYTSLQNLTSGSLNASLFPEYSDVLGFNPHPAGFGQGYGGLEKNQKYFDVHMGRLVDGGVLTTALFGVIWTQ